MSDLNRAVSTSEDQMIRWKSCVWAMIPRRSDGEHGKTFSLRARSNFFAGKFLLEWHENWKSSAIEASENLFLVWSFSNQRNRPQVTGTEIRRHPLKEWKEKFSSRKLFYSFFVFSHHLKDISDIRVNALYLQVNLFPPYVFSHTRNQLDFVGSHSINSLHEMSRYGDGCRKPLPWINSSYEVSGMVMAAGNPCRAIFGDTGGCNHAWGRMPMQIESC